MLGVSSCWSIAIAASGWLDWAVLGFEVQGCGWRVWLVPLLGMAGETWLVQVVAGGGERTRKRGPDVQGKEIYLRWEREKETTCDAADGNCKERRESM